MTALQMITELVGVLAWPTVIAIALLMLRPRNRK